MGDKRITITFETVYLILPEYDSYIMELRKTLKRRPTLGNIKDMLGDFGENFPEEIKGNHYKIGEYIDKAVTVRETNTKELIFWLEPVTIDQETFEQLVEVGNSKNLTFASACAELFNTTGTTIRYDRELEARYYEQVEYPLKVRRR